VFLLCLSGHRKTVRAPEAAGLIALPFEGRGKTAEISFAYLNQAHKIPFWKFSRPESSLSGNSPDFLNVHNALHKVWVELSN
jgi:hypothetical protein